MSDQIEVIYAMPSRQFVQRVEIKEDDTFQSIIEKSKLLEVFPELELEKLNIGSYGKSKKLNDPISKYDRVEIYREVTADPRKAIKR